MSNPEMSTSTKVRNWVIVIAVGAAIWLTPVPEGVDPSSWHLLALFVATIVGFILHIDGGIDGVEDIHQLVRFPRGFADRFHIRLEGFVHVTEFPRNLLHASTDLGELIADLIHRILGLFR